MGSNPLDTFRRKGEADERRPAPRSRPDANPVTGPYASAPGNPVPAPPKLR